MTIAEIAAAAQAYLDSGLCVLPARLQRKCPALPSWKAYQARLPSRTEVQAWFANPHDALCIVTGGVSGNTEILDFDAGGALFDEWVEIVTKQAPGLLERLVIERSPSGGFHVAYRCIEPICGNMKLAQRRQADGKLQTMIETRGEGGLFLCAPTAGYELIQGALTSLPVLTPAEWDILLSAAWSLNEYVAELVDGPKNANVAAHVATGPAIPATARPGDDYGARGDVREILVRHGWTQVKGGDNEYWRRPGKTDGWSATLKDRVFYVFSSNAEPFEPHKGYSPFAVYTWLEHNGDFTAAAAKLREQGFGEDVAAYPEVDLSNFYAESPDELDAKAVAQDPGPMPEKLLRIPGFVSEMMDFCLATAPYPNQVMAFCGAVALQSFLAARKVRDPGDNRTNLYLLGLAYSSGGKDWPRRINTRLLHEIGLGHCTGDKFASGEGLQDALFLNPAMLFQSDEIDGMLQSISKSKEARYENLMGTLLTMYTSSASVYPMRRKAGKENPGAIDQPSLTIFGTAVPTHYYEALSARMLSNGFFARMIVLEAGARGDGQEPSIQDLPPRLVQIARWWADFQPGHRTGNLLNLHPIPAIVPHSDPAKALLIETRKAAEAEYAAAEARSDEVETTVWGRVSENTRKLALIYAVSENHTNPVIGPDAVAWASAFAQHQTRRMLFMASQHVAEGDFDADCKRLVRVLREWKKTNSDKWMPFWRINRKLPWPERQHEDVRKALQHQRIIEYTEKSTGGSPQRLYRLL